MQTMQVFLLFSLVFAGAGHVQKKQASPSTNEIATDESLSSLAALLLAPRSVLKPSTFSVHPTPIALRKGAVSARRGMPKAEEGEEESAKGKTPIEELEIGQEVEGTVKSVQEFGAFVNFGAAKDGLLHASQWGDEYVADMKEKVSQGDVIKCRILKIDEEKGQVALTRKEKQETKQRAPVVNVDLTTYINAKKNGDVIQATVARITDFGAFINLEPGLDGLLHISQISDERIEQVSDKLSVGDSVSVRVQKVDLDTKKVALTMREPDSSSSKNDENYNPALYVVGSKHEGTITQITNFGAFVDIGGGKDVMVHISQISEDRIENIEDLLSIGDAVKLTITEVTDRGVSGSMREQKEVDLSAVAVGSKCKGTIKQISTFGLFVDIGVGKDVFVHVSQCTKKQKKGKQTKFDKKGMPIPTIDDVQRANSDRIDDLEKEFAVGDNIDLWIQEASPQKISGTMKQDGGDEDDTFEDIETDFGFATKGLLDRKRKQRVFINPGVGKTDLEAALMKVGVVAKAKPAVERAPVGKYGIPVYGDGEDEVAPVATTKVAVAPEATEEAAEEEVVA